MKTVNLKIIFQRMISIILISLISFPCFYPQSHPDKDTQNKFVIAFIKNTITDVNINDAVVALKVWAQEVNNRMELGYEPNVLVYDNIEELIKKVNKDNVSMVVCNSLDYLQNKSKLPIRPVMYNPNPYPFILTVRRKDDIKDLSELRGKKIILDISINAEIQYMWLKVLLKENNCGEYKSFFKEIKEGDASSQAILSVFFGQSDACIVNKSAFQTMIELNPQVGKSLKILKSSEPFANGLAFFTLEFLKHKETCDKILKSAFEVESYPAGKQIFALLRTKQVVPYKDEGLESTQNLMDLYNKLFPANRTAIKK